ncbi:hypothetical protein Patl1_20688 [Pistacia atlantica]|uniref:Uncharacterized protein n=1 Tax=Pistacia atlantica TaxID=434234 RepID=A0ACC1BJA8_9ROSI|nr:hypothetical protein Patl1_20688 [Pistacia atlantica]
MLEVYNLTWRRRFDSRKKEELENSYQVLIPHICKIFRWIMNHKASGPSWSINGYNV